MSEGNHDLITKEITNELELLTKATVVKLSSFFDGVSLGVDNTKIANINSASPFIRYCLLIPKCIESSNGNKASDVSNGGKYISSVINSTLSGIKKELNDIVSFRFVESNLKYTGFSISPVGFTLEVPKSRIVAVKIRKIAIEIVASLQLDELKQEVLCTSNSKLPRDLVFAALRKRREMAGSLTMPHNEYDIEEIDFRIGEVREAMKSSSKKDELIAS